MTPTPERILLVGNDPEINDLIGRQALQPLGYSIEIAADVNRAISEVAQTGPDLVIADLDMPGLNGRDLLVALNSQGLEIPVIVVAHKGEEKKVIQAFRLGAEDYLLWPAREGEVVTAVERLLKQIRDRRARKNLDQRLTETNEELQRRLRELTTLIGVGKAVVSITDPHQLFEKIVEGTVYLAEADHGWLTVREDRNHPFILAAHHNLPDRWASKVGQPLDDGISSLVAVSGETLGIQGEPLRRFKVAELGRSALVVPVKIQQEVIGLLAVIRKEERPFTSNTKTLLEAVTDYASVSLVNARLFRAIQENAETARKGEAYNREQLQVTRGELQKILLPASLSVESLLGGKMGSLSEEQQAVMRSVQVALQNASALSAEKTPPSGTGKI